MKKKAIIFDHDGTLVDSIDCVVFCTNKVIENAGFKSEPVEKIKHGMAYATAERFGFHTGITDTLALQQMSAEFYAVMNNEGLAYLKLYPGIKECLNILAKRGYALGMVTNNQGYFVRRAAAGLEFAYDFSVILGEEDVPATKPDPGGLLQACAGLGGLPENCWYIGDGKPDYEAAKAGGLKSGLVT
jgi:phosphoglycolate phosphatase